MTPLLLSLAIDPKTPTDAQRLAHALQQLTAEDPELRVRTGHIAGAVVIGCGSEEHLATVVDRLGREFHVEASVGRPEIAYREALTRPADGEAKYACQTRGRGEYGHVKIRLYPGRSGTGYVFENHLYGGVIPAEFIEPIKEGVQDALTRGVVAGYPINDVRVELYDASYHDADSTDGAFRMAGSLAVENAARKADPIVLEPVMHVEAVVPAEYLADVMNSLLLRRGQIRSREDCGDTHIIRALVPLAGLFGYGIDLRSRTRGRGTCAMQFEEYVPLQAADDDDDCQDAMVGARLKPAPTLRDSGIALSEPDVGPTRFPDDELSR